MVAAALFFVTRKNYNPAFFKGQKSNNSTTKTPFLKRIKMRCEIQTINAIIKLVTASRATMSINCPFITKKSEYILVIAAFCRNAPNPIDFRHE